MKYLLLSLLAAGSVAAAVTGEFGQTIRSVELKGQPSVDAARVTTLPEKTRVEIIKRQGAWLQVKAPGGSGWVRLLTVRGDGVPAKSSAAGGLKALGSLATTGTSGTAPVATGVRGLSEEDLAHARENPDELAKMQSLASSAGEARAFAAQASLQAKPVAYLAGAGAKGKGAAK